ncbi:ATP-binding protein [Halostella salina]|uniref:ATP-binding protein n=1 Tax=Halostella salina TaxID=1547897 RepID=UPI000EF7C8FC|nr:AAA family ATPase [Halostella salina]
MTDTERPGDGSTAFPFTALVNQTEMKRALLLNAVDPGIGGVLVRGERGTAKSTAVRALGDVLPDRTVVADCPYGCPPDDPARMCEDCRERHGEGDLPTETRPMRVVDLPLNATEDRLTGTLDIERALGEGEARFEPGVLAAANRNVLYVDEVNLLDDHLVDSLLDAAAMGENVVEREGISHRHPAEFVLVGTMNPEEGSLRPQLLDRFGLVVDVSGVQDVEERVEISERRAAFDADPAAFRAEYAADQQALTRRIVDARGRLSEVSLPDPLARAVAATNVRLGVDGHRGDTTLRRAARALAAFRGESTVTADALRDVAGVALDHRTVRLPFEEDAVAVDDALSDALAEYATPEAGPPN